jgi:uncharacterized membrane protein YoaK (UPF0700 family)
VTTAAGPSTRSVGRSDAAILSFVAAFVDTVGFIGLFGLFTAHVTGNIVLAGASIVSREDGYALRLFAIPVFALALAIAVLYADHRRRLGRERVIPLLVSECALITLSLAVAVLAGPFAAAAEPAAAAAVLLLVSAMAVQNAMMRLELDRLPPTTVMTGNVTQVVIDLVRLAHDATEPDVRSLAGRRLRAYLPTLGAFVLGAAAAAAGCAVAGLVSLVVPIVAAGAHAAVLARRSEAAGVAAARTP